MNKNLLAFLFLFSTIASAQTNELAQCGYRNMLMNTLIEDQNNYYFLGKNGMFYKCNKWSHSPVDSVVALSNIQSQDSVVNRLVYISKAGSRICFSYNKSILIDTVAAPYDYWTANYYQELDTLLNIVIPEKRLLMKDPRNRRFVNPWVNAITVTNQRSLIIYTEYDSYSMGNGFSRMSSFFLLDAFGNVLRHDTLRPGPIISDTLPALHLAQEVSLTANNQFMISGYGLLASQNRSFVMCDSNMTIIDTFQFRSGLWSGSFHGSFPNTVSLPTGNLITGGMYDSSQFGGGVHYETSAVSKSSDTLGARYYFGRPVVYSLKDAADHHHQKLYQGLAYNKTDNRIYYTDKTHARGFDLDYCDGPYNYVQVICADTNLVTLWRKFIYSGNNFCLTTSGIQADGGREGATIEGYSANADTSKQYSFIYHIDSSTTTGIANTNNVIIRDRIKMYPNPATTQVTVDDFLSQLKSVSMYNMQGALVATKAAASSSSLTKLELNVSHLPAGVYLVRAVTEDGEVSSQQLFKN